MRKALILLVVFAMVGAAAFADGTPKWSINTWYGFALASPSAGSNLQAFDWASEQGGRTRLGFTYTAADGNVGFNSRLEMNGNLTIAAFNQLNGWAKLFGGMVTVRAGVNDDYTIGTVDWNDFGNIDGKLGVFIDIAPMAGLDIGFFQRIPMATILPIVPVANFVDGDIIGAKFAIKDIGDLAAGFIFGDKLPAYGLVATDNAVYFGFALKAVSNLTATIEGKATLATASTPIQLDEHLSYAMGALTVGAYVGEVINGSTFDWGVEPSVAYKINDNLTINAMANVYSSPLNDQTIFLSGALYGGIINGGAAATTNFGAGASLTWAEGGFKLTVGDYYGAASTGGNVFYVNADVAL